MFGVVDLCEQVATAAFDPIFWSHHAMIDRLWYLWQLRIGNSRMPPELLNVVLAPFNLTVRDVLNIYDLGYEYARLAISRSGWKLRNPCLREHLDQRYTSLNHFN